MEFGPHDALIVVDVQRDFLPGGALAVEDGDAVIPVLNRWIAEARRLGVPVVASRDRHPPNHVSFAERGGPWPPHCIRNTPGAEFSPELDLPDDAWIVDKGTDAETEQYSAFGPPGLAERLQREGVRRLWIGGLAEDVCVRQTALDAVAAGFEVHLLASATRPVTAEGGRKALEEMRAAGVQIESGENHD